MRVGGDWNGNQTERYVRAIVTRIKEAEPSRTLELVSLTTKLSAVAGGKTKKKNEKMKIKNALDMAPINLNKSKVDNS